MSYLLPSLGLLSPGPFEFFLLLLIIMLLFGAKKLPMLAKGLGAGIRNFKGELKNPADEEDTDEVADVTAAPAGEGEEPALDESA